MFSQRNTLKVCDENQTENRSVGGSIPPLGTSKIKYLRCSFPLTLHAWTTLWTTSPSFRIRIHGLRLLWCSPDIIAGLCIRFVERRT